MTSRVHLPLLLLAFTIALVIKLTVHDGDQISERIIEAQITYNTPPDSNLISFDKPETVKVGVRGQSDEVIQLSVFTVEVVVSLEVDKIGPVEINLGPENVAFRTVGDFEVLSIEPNRFTIQVETWMVSTVPVKVVFIGEPAAGARNSEPVVRPAWVEISGPQSLVRRVTELTVPVSLEGHAVTFEDSVPVASPDPLIQVQPGRVLVQVPMQEPELSVNLDDASESEQE